MANEVVFDDFCRSLPFLNTLAKLMKEADIKNQLDLPKVVVLGSQGAGKSSVIELLLGLDFLPRNSEICIERPLELKLVNMFDGIPFAVFDEVDGKIFDFTKVKNTIIRLNKESTNDCNKNKLNPIALTIYSKSCPDLTIIELPETKRISGIPRISMNKVLDEPIWEYVHDPQNIILAVFSVNMHTNILDLLALSSQVSQSSDRTLAVFTKIDSVDDYEIVRSILLDESVKIKYGSIAVNSQRKPDESIIQALHDEKMYFAAHEFYSKMAPENFGIDNLIRRVSDIIYQRIKLLLPAIIKLVAKKLIKCEERLKVLEVSSVKNIYSKYHLWVMVTEFCELLKSTIYGKYEKQHNSKISKHLAAGATIKSVYNSILGDYLGDYKASKAYTDEYIIKVIEIYEGDSIPGFYSIDAFIELVQPLIMTLKSPIMDCLMEIYGYLECLIKGIISKIFSIFPSVSSEVSKLAIEVLNSGLNTTQELIENILKAGENYIFTNDISSLIIPHANLDIKNSPSAALITQLRTRIDNYLKIIINNYRDSIPKIIGYFLVRKSIEKMQKVLFEVIGNSEVVVNKILDPEFSCQETEELKAQVNALHRLLKTLRYDKEFEERVSCFNRWLEEREKIFKC